MYDLPIALSILAASGQLDHRHFINSSFIGELSLDGKIKPVKGLISMTEKAASLGKKYFFVPGKITHQAGFFKKISIIPCKDLKSITEVLKDNELKKKTWNKTKKQRQKAKRKKRKIPHRKVDRDVSSI